MTAIPSLSSTAETRALAERIVALMAAEAMAEPDSPPPIPPPHQADPSQEQGTGAGTEQEQAQASSDPTTGTGPSMASEGEDAQGDADNAQGATDGPGETEQDQERTRNGESQTGTSAGDATADQTEGQEPGGGSMAEAGHADEASDEAETAPVSQASGEGAGGALAQTLLARESDFPEDVFTRLAEVLETHRQSAPTLMPTLEQADGPEDQGQVLLQRVRAQSARLSTRLQALVEAHTRTRTRITRRGRHLSGRLLHRAGVGDARLFRHRDQRRAPNTAIHLLVDLSSSMLYGQDRLALEAAMALALALEPIRGVSCAVTAFPDRQGRDTQVTQLLAHGQRVAPHAGAFVGQGRGSTPMTGALWFAAADLLARPEPRKVLLTLTDGDPNNVSSTRALIQQASGAGIELIGVGIAHDVSALFPLAIRIGTIASLQPALFSVAEQLLLSQRD